MSDEPLPWPELSRVYEGGDGLYEYQRARAEAAMSRLRIAIEPLKLAAMTIGCSCACKRCSTASNRVYEALALIGELPPETGKA